MQIPNGYHDLPPGKIASIVTYLEMTEPPADLAMPPPAGMQLRKWPTPDLAWYRDLFRSIGEPWLWFSRAVMPDNLLAAIITDPRVEIHTLQKDGRDIGMIEINRLDPPSVELSYFGLTPDAIGQGAGRYLIKQAIRLAFDHQPSRFWLHTCTLDHPRALEFYRKTGFRPYKRQVEVADDPRLTGKMPRSAGPLIPIL